MIVAVGLFWGDPKPKRHRIYLNGQFPANRYSAAWASASLAKRTRFCGETFAAPGQSGRW